jgi:hypothetical protein
VRRSDEIRDVDVCDPAVDQRGEEVSYVEDAEDGVG